jgi:hypothetical protein
MPSTAEISAKKGVSLSQVETACTPSNVQRASKIIMENRHVTVHGLSHTKGLGCAKLHAIIHDDLKIKKMYICPVPWERDLTPEQ